MLRFDQSGAVHADYGVTQEQLKSLYPRLTELRRDWVEAALQPIDSGFYRLPKAQLDAYTKHREASELGRIFKVANSQMGIVDAVVVLGIGGYCHGPQALLEASCDPYHNELRRGPRGGKPRFYFAGNDFDNDESQALLSRIAAGGYGETEEEEKWSLVVISKTGETAETAIAFRQFHALLQNSLQGDDSGLLPRLVVPITGSTGKLHDLATTIKCEEIFGIPKEVSDRFSILSPVGLIPAAMIGLDIMKLLEGAVAMNEHFETMPPDKNMVLQYVAINYLLEKHHGAANRRLRFWNKSLAAVGSWYDHHRQQPQGQSASVIHNLIVENCRTDPLPVGSSEFNQDSLIDIADQDLPDIMAAAIRDTNAALHAQNHPTTDFILPTIDTFVLGQLFQMLMIATAIDERLQCKTIDPIVAGTRHE